MTKTGTESISPRDGTPIRAAKVSLIVLSAALLGAILTFVYLRHKQDPFAWRHLDVDKPSYTGEALFDSDIPLPDIKNSSGEAKFRTAPGSGREVELGYVMEFDIDKLEKDKVPEKYRKPTKYQAKQGEVTWDPVAEVVYIAKFDFTLRDKDGFELKKLESRNEYIESGKRNRLQGLVPDAVPLEIAERTQSIKALIYVQKYETCR